jgi:nicotinamidase-related amidase
LQNTKGSEFHPDLHVNRDDIVIYKGTNEDVESYSGFGNEPEKTDLLEKLQRANIDTVYILGLAYDYCVGSTALDAVENGFKTYVIRDATKSVAKESEEIMY